MTPETAQPRSEDPAWPHDGRVAGYLPRPGLRFDPDLLHTDAAEAVDPVTFEIIRSHLWTLNLEHGDTIQRASGSPTVIYAGDFNQSIHCEDGDPVVLGPSMLSFTGLADLAIRWTLENRAVSPGIHDGDIFLHNDPWVGAGHQQDSTVYSPVFVDGRIFSWVLNTCHERDIGGVEPGSFVPQARDVFWESTPVPPIKIAQGDKILADVEEMFVRKSRLPQLCTLEIRSQIAGVLSAKRRLGELLDRYGAPVVKAVMYKVIADCERTVRDRLERLPDGQWSHRAYYAGCEPGDRALHEQVLTMTKAGSTLSWDNRGTDEQRGQSNATTGAWRANIVAVVMNHLAYDQYLCAGGVLRVLDFDPVPGLRTSCTWPAAVTGSAGAARTTVAQASHLLSQMLSCDDELARHAWGAEGVHTIVNAVFHGRRDDGRSFAGTPIDMMAGSTGGRTFGDGMSASSWTTAPLSHTADVEVWEQNLGILYLYRRRQRIGGHGRWVGGSSLVSAYVGHHVVEQSMNNNTAANALPTGPGLGGAYPAPGGGVFHAPAAGVRAAIEAGAWIDSPESLRRDVRAGSLTSVLPKVTGLPFGLDDVCEVWYSSAAGVGDPVDRPESSVVDDLATDRITRDVAERIYGVVVDGAGGLRPAETAERRASIRRTRIDDGRSSAPLHRQDPEVAAAPRAHPLGPALEVARAGGGAFYRCARCAWVVAPVSENYKDRALHQDVALPEIDAALFVDPRLQVDDAVVCRLYACPGCGGLFDSEITRPSDPPQWDVRLG